MFYLNESDKRVVESFDNLHMKDGKSANLFFFFHIDFFSLPQRKTKYKYFKKRMESNFFTLK